MKIILDRFIPSSESLPGVSREAAAGQFLARYNILAFSGQNSVINDLQLGTMYANSSFNCTIIIHPTTQYNNEYNKIITTTSNFASELLSITLPK